ncbi:MAG: hypothetical protein JXA20_10270 [Spirochaetes bacterium]|nr:hypothetical protein [Spirochaetota bacterium]
MAQDGSAIDINWLRERLRAIDRASPASPLCFCPPSAKNADFFRELCDAYRGAPPAERDMVRREAARCEGVVDALLAFLYGCIEEFRGSGDGSPLMTALAAASIRGDGPDFRDFYMALAELYTAFKEAGLDPVVHFNAMGGGVPADFHTFAVVRGR